MRPGIIVDVTAADRARLEAVMADRNSPQKHAWRAAIVLATADGLGTNAIMRRTGMSKTAVWRWQSALPAKVPMAFCGTRHALRGSRRSGRRWESASSRSRYLSHP